MNITIQEAKELISNMFKTFLSPDFCELSPMIFVHETNECQEIISVTILKRPKFLLLHLGARVRFPQVQEILTGQRNDKFFAGNYGGLIHLIAELPFIEWRCVNKEEIATFTSDAKEMIIRYAIPFLKQHNSLLALENKLSSNIPKDWITLDNEDRIVNLSAVNFVLGNIDNALRILDDYLTKVAGKSPKHYSRVYELKNRILHFLKTKD